MTNNETLQLRVSNSLRKYITVIENIVCKLTNRKMAILWNFEFTPEKFVHTCCVWTYWRKLHNEELHLVYSLPNFVIAITPRCVLQACDRRQILIEFLREVLKKRHILGDISIVDRIILKWILNKKYGSVWPGFTKRCVGLFWKL